MPKVKVTSTKGLVQEKGNGMENQVGMYSGQGTTTAAADAVLLGEGFVHTVDSANNAHKVKMPKAQAAGQIMVIRNVDSAQDVVIRNNADDGTLVTLGEGKTAVLLSSDAGDNWSGSQVD